MYIWLSWEAAWRETQEFCHANNCSGSDGSGCSCTAKYKKIESLVDVQSF